MSSQMLRAHQPDASQGHSYNPLSSYSQHPQSPSIHPSFLSPSAIALLLQSSQESATRTNTTSTTIFNQFSPNCPTYLLQSLATRNPNPYPPSEKMLLQQQSLNWWDSNRLCTLLVHPPGNWEAYKGSRHDLRVSQLSTDRVQIGRRERLTSWSHSLNPVKCLDASIAKFCS